ncbi:transcriptional regulator, TetR family [Rubellimicrobium thermophilum DSM 16684]|uniref:HTH-type transcriptional regulator BetI n=1 Tax=Rubellimicrobium thermophilum DSM 16684 TaxID=1123069 RepID=S9R3J6_9RHOB|nr:transcriptional regulator BetI [Rubellimicrobium thermophilum]EPX86548.1 transcriptional regulator, TetR family [Rubellimicrobium thermophilum DSM 16684]
MARSGAEPIRRAAIVKATIQEIGRAGSLDVTVAQIAARAGVSAALAHHYFGSKEAIFVAAFRHVLIVYGAEVRGALALASTPRERLEAVVRASFSPSSFRRDTISAWLNFYVLAQTMPEARRLLSIYHRRLRSNLCHALRPLVGARAGRVADGIGALIDGVYLRQALSPAAPDRAAATALVLDHVSREIDA